MNDKVADNDRSYTRPSSMYGFTRMTNLYLQERYSRFPVVADSDKIKFGLCFSINLTAYIKSMISFKIMRDISVQKIWLHDVMDEMIIKRSTQLLL